MTHSTSSYLPSNFATGVGLMAGGTFAALIGATKLCCFTKKEASKIGAIAFLSLGLSAIGVGFQLVTSDNSKDGIEGKREFALLVGQGKALAQPYMDTAANWAVNSLPETVSNSSYVKICLDFLDITIIKNGTSAAA